MRWGLVPSWATEIKGPLMINARMETVMEKPAYRRLIPRGERRALQLADGYYEWLKPERRGEPRQPFHFQVDGGVPFAFAALWTPAKVEGEWLHSITLLTCDSAPEPRRGGDPRPHAGDPRRRGCAGRVARPGASERRKRSRCAARCRPSGCPRTRPTRPSTRRAHGARGTRAARRAGVSPRYRGRSAATITEIIVSLG